MTSYRKAPDEAKRKKKLTRLSGLTEQLIAPALARKSAYLNQLIAHWPQIAGPYAAWAQPADIHPATSDADDGTLTLSIHSGRGPEALATSDDILRRVNQFMGFQLVSQLRVKQDLPLTSHKSAQPAPQGLQEPQTKEPSASLKEALDKLGKTLETKGRK